MDERNPQRMAPTNSEPPASIDIDSITGGEEHLDNNDNNQHLIAMIRSSQEDDLGNFFATMLSTVRRFSERNIIELKNQVEREIWAIELEEFFDNIID